MPSQAAAPHSETKKIGLKTLWDRKRFRGISMRVVKVVKGSTDRTIQRLCSRVFGAFPGAALHRNNPNQRVAGTRAGAALMDGKQRPVVAKHSVILKRESSLASEVTAASTCTQVTHG